MKKFLSLFLVVFTLVAITACTNDTKKKTTTVETTTVANEAPEILGADDVEVLLNEAFDSLAGVTAEDDKDSDLNITVEGTVDVATEGEYTLTYSVTDSDGETTTVTRIVTVTQVLSAVIYGIDAITVIKGDTFDPMADVEAEDEVDGDLTARIVVTGTVDMDTLGEYELTYTVTNDGGKVTEETRIVTVDVESPEILFSTPNQHLINTAFDSMAGVTAKDREDDVLTDDVTVVGTVDTTTEGVYTLTYKVTNSYGKDTMVTRNIKVVTELVDYANGTFNYRFASTELRNTFFAAAEKYLINNMYAGVPVFANAGYALYSSRLQLPVDQAVPVLDYGNIFSTMSADDSTVLMDDGQLGNVGEYTYRASLAQNPTTFQQWIYDDATSADVIDLILDAPYVFKFNDDKDGYALVPSMATDLPQAQNPTTLDTGVEVAKVWRISLRNDLVWTYHADTDTSAFPDGHEKIDATDFIDTYKLAIESKWFRAISGGGDFLSSSQEIKGAQDFVDGDGEWADVGLKKIDDYTLEFEFVGDMSEWNVRYWLGSFVMGPINMDLYDAVGDSYGTSAETTAFNGQFKMDYYESDRIIRFSKNADFHDKESYFFTHYTYAIIEDREVRFQEFIGGKLEAAALPTAKYENFKNHPGLKRLPGATTFRIMINGLGTVGNQQAQFPGSDFVPEPLLANQDFKKAMYLSIDRLKLATEVLKTSEAQQYLFTDAYLVEALSGIPFRTTDIGNSVSDGLSPTTYGFNADASKDWWNAAIDALVADGSYAAGTAANPTIIEMDFNVFSGSEAQQLLGDFIKASFEEIFVSDTHNIKVKVNVTPKDFPSIYYDYMMIGNFDLSIGGISGSTLDAASFLDTYCSDNRSGFSLNWGVDTSIAEIEVTYVDPATDAEITEMWSFDSIYEVLNGEVYVVDGVETEAPEATTAE
jgi:ABC-type oligopeptide transport system substrate-binding subunit